MTEAQKESTVQFTLGRTAEAEFRAAFGAPLPEEPSAKVALLNAAIESRDPDEVECAMLLCLRFGGYSRELVEVLCRLLREPWHDCHEDLALALEELQDERSVDALYEAATRKYDYYDEGHAVARKCTWALARIASPAARTKLEALASCGDPVVEAYARKRPTA
jgi:hypothetical protein